MGRDKWLLQFETYLSKSIQNEAIIEECFMLPNVNTTHKIVLGSAFNYSNQTVIQPITALHNLSDEAQWNILDKQKIFD